MGYKKEVGVPSFAALITIAVGDAIRELKEIPSGHLYARLMDKMDLYEYQSIIGFLIKNKLVTESKSHLLTWVGPIL